MPVNVFGNGAVQTAYVNYRPVDLTTASQVLVWPTSYVDTPYTLAAAMNVNTLNPNVNTLTLPDAREASVGQNFIINNIGASSFAVLNAGGGTVLAAAVCLPGTTWWFLLTDTTYANGVWTVIQYGVGASSANPNALAGPGLVANGLQLNTNFPVMTKAVAYTVLPTDVAKLIVWTGGGATITLPVAGTVVAGFYVAFNNEGTGELNLVGGGGETIDKLPNIAVELNQSLSVIWDGTQWWTLGFGQNVFSSITALNKNVSGNQNFVLTPSEANFYIQQYSGLLTGNIIIYFPVVTNDWYVRNLTTGGFTLSIQLGTQAVPVGQAYVIGQGDRQIFYSDGTSLFSIPTHNTITFADGTAAAPSITFSNDTSTGIYRDPGAPVSLGISVTGATVANYATVGLAMAAGKTIKITDGTAAATTTLSTNASYASLGWINGPNNGEIRINGGAAQTILGVMSGGGGFNLDLIALAASGAVRYNSINAITISNTAAVTVPVGLTVTAGGIGITAGGINVTAGGITVVAGGVTTNSLTLTGGATVAINQGGTGQATAPLAINALMPVSVNGALAYYNGTNWLTLPPGANGTTLKMAGGIPTWTP